MSAQVEPQETPVGRVSHYFDHLQAVAVNLTDSRQKGDTIHSKGRSTDLTCTVDSLQVDHQEARQADSGASVGIKICGRVHEGDHVYRIVS